MKRNSPKKKKLIKKSAGKLILSPALKKLLPKQIKAALRNSEIRYRRLFEAAQDGILILDAETARITDVNPYLIQLLGRSREKLLGKTLWEIGLFQDMEKSRTAFKELQKKGYIRYEDLPLETLDGRYIDVEFVSNVYMANGINVIQCNIRDITLRKHAEVERAILETVEEEQRRIGQDLHDGLCQQLAGVALLAKALAHKLVTVTPHESADATEIAELINQAINQTRDLARGLSPVEIEVAGFVPALQKFADSTEWLYKISCEFIHSENAEFQCKYEPLLATHLYRIVQEAVSNAIQHGKPKKVVITLTTLEDRGLLTIQDDGSGFEVNNDDKAGLGLRSMRCRGRMIGAWLKISRDALGGTIVSCSFPSDVEKNFKKHQGFGKHEKN